MSNLTKLASTITQQAKQLAAYIEDNDLPNPTFTADGPAFLPIPPSSKLRAAQQALYSAAQDLAILAIGPVEHLRWQAAHVRQLNLPDQCKRTYIEQSNLATQHLAQQ